MLIIISGTVLWNHNLNSNNYKLNIKNEKNLYLKMSYLVPVVSGLISNYLPFGDQSIKLQVGLMVGEIIRNMKFSDYLNSLYNTKNNHLIIPYLTKENEINSLYTKFEDYLIDKFVIHLKSFL